MIGTTFLYSKQINEKSLGLLTKEPWHDLSITHKTDNSILCYSHYKGYLIETWSHLDYIIIKEGAIYNICKEEIQNSINAIAECIDKPDQCKQLIRDFILKADGEFGISFYNQKNQSLLFFNDILGGLPFYYTCNNGIASLSRSFSFVLSQLPNKGWSNNNIAEFLSLGYNLRERTLSSLVSKTRPATLLTVETENGPTLNVEVIYKDDFNITNRYQSKQEAVNDLVKLFLEGCASRVEYAEKNGFDIVNTMSGGFDSRTVLGGIEKSNVRYTNLTYEYIQDESQIAKRVVDTVDSKSEYVKLSFKNTPDLYNVNYVLNTDGRVNVFTNSVCYNDMLEVRKHFGDRRIMYFGGFGGEYIRHPRYPDFISFDKSFCSQANTFFFTPIICNSNYESIKGNIVKDFDIESLPKEVLFKDLYNEYYQNLVRCSGEDRTRMFYYTVQPMMSKDFIFAIRHRLPLKWAGFSFYGLFLKSLDKRLLDVPIYGKPESFLSNTGLKHEDLSRHLMMSIKNTIRYYLNKYTRYEYRKQNEYIPYDRLEPYLKQLSNLSIFNEQFIENNYKYFDKTLQYTILDVVLYITEIEKQ